MSKKIYLCIIMSLIILFGLLSTKSYADKAIIIDIGEEKFFEEDEIQTNSNSTATYSYTDKTLKLNNYDGKPINYYGSDPLTIILNGENKITSEYYSEDGIYSESAGLSFTGNGSLLLQDIRNGISVSTGDLIINDVNISIKNLFGNGIITWDGKVEINGNISMDDDLEKKELEMGYAPNYQAINVEGGNIIINSDVDIKNAGKALLTDNKVIINSGKVDITTLKTSIDTLQGFEMLDGEVDIEIAESDDILYNLNYGIRSEGIINIKSGVLHIKVPNNSITIASVNDEPTFTISDDLAIVPENCSLQIITIDDTIIAKTLGLEEETVTFDFDNGYLITNGVPEITIKEKIAKREEEKQEDSKDEEVKEEVKEEQKEEMSKEEKATEEAKTTNPQTGDTIYYTISALLISIVGLVITKKKYVK